MSIFKRTVLLVGLGISGALIAALSGPTTVMAETKVGGTLNGDAVWTAANSPYVLDADLMVPAGSSLRIESGASVMADPALDEAPNLSVYGQLDISGSPTARVSVKGLNQVWLDNATGTIAYTDFDMLGDLGSYSSHTSVSHSTMTGAWSGIYVMSGSLAVDSSRFADNDYGVMNASTAPVYQVRGPGGRGAQLAYVGDMKALALGGYPPADVSITGSSFVGNHTAAVWNRDAATVHVENNWWGSPAGPAQGDLIGTVSYSPWLDHDPTADAEAPCCSSVLFLPGIEGSRLYVDQKRPILGRLVTGRPTTTNELWVPGNSSDVSGLYMKSDGSSADSTIYSGAPIDKAYGLVDVYGGFMSLLDGLVSKGTVNEWRAFGYDWRKPIVDVVGGPEKKATTTESLISVVEDMASSSKTGKVSIVAHSNGGLVAKYLVKKLTDIGKASLIDSVVSVAVPFLGTPAAMPALLYGDGQSIAWGLIATQGNMQGLAQNMPSAYSLLPSAGYFSKTAMPTIVSASTSASTASVQDSFLAAAGSNTSLLKAAEALHATLDPFVWPATIARWALAGWGKDTTFGLGYSSDGSHSQLVDPYGDGTVKAESATQGIGQIIPADLKTISDLERADFSHTNILESSSTQTAVKDILIGPSNHNDPSCTDDPAACNTKVTNELKTIPGITVGNMDWNALEKEYLASKKDLYVRVHSPVALNVYDSQGRHTGEVPLPPELAAQVDPGFLKMFEAKIPGSNFTTNSGDDYITLPDDGQTYTVSVQGTDVGSFGLEIGRERATSTVEIIEWTDVPVTPISSATTTLISNGAFNVAGTELASSSAPLRLDIDGDNVVDATSSIGQFDQSLSPDLLGKVCKSFGKGAAKCNAFTDKVKRAKDAVASWRHSHIGRFILKGDDGKRQSPLSGHFGLRGLNSTDRDNIIDRMSDFLDRFQH